MFNLIFHRIYHIFKVIYLRRVHFILIESFLPVAPGLVKLLLGDIILLMGFSHVICLIVAGTSCNFSNKIFLLLRQLLNIRFFEIWSCNRVINHFLIIFINYLADTFLAAQSLKLWFFSLFSIMAFNLHYIFLHWIDYSFDLVYQCLLYFIVLHCMLYMTPKIIKVSFGNFQLFMSSFDTFA